MPPLVPEPLDPREVSESARWLAQAYDPGSGLVRFVAMELEDYRAASFLDDRMFQQRRDIRALAWKDVTEAMSGSPREDARWIFHIGHVGSTLVARMLGELQGLLSVREPRILRDLAMLDPEQRAPMASIIRRLCSRSFAPDQAAVVKATSFVSEIAALLVSPGGRAIFMHVGVRSYVETILAGENSVKELHALHDYRASRMAGRVPAMAKAAASDAHRAAMAWACEMTALEAAAEALADRAILWLDFDQFLQEPAKDLANAAGHFGCDLGPDEATSIATGPLMNRYSKALEYDYSPALRQELQSEARRWHGAAIDSADAMLDEASRGSPLLKRALERSA